MRTMRRIGCSRWPCSVELGDLCQRRYSFLGQCFRRGRIRTKTSTMTAGAAYDVFMRNMKSSTAIYKAISWFRSAPLF